MSDSNYTINETVANLLYGSLNSGASAVIGDGEFVVLGLPVFLRRLNTSFDIKPTHVKSILSSADVYGTCARCAVRFAASISVGLESYRQ